MIKFFLFFVLISSNLMAKCSCKKLLKLLERPPSQYEVEFQGQKRRVGIVLKSKKGGVALFSYQTALGENAIFHILYTGKGSEDNTCDLKTFSGVDKLQSFALNCDLSNQRFILADKYNPNNYIFRYRKLK